MRYRRRLRHRRPRNTRNTLAAFPPPFKSERFIMPSQGVTMVVLITDSLDVFPALVRRSDSTRVVLQIVILPVEVAKTYLARASDIQTIWNHFPHDDWLAWLRTNKFAAQSSTIGLPQGDAYSLDAFSTSAFAEAMPSANPQEIDPLVFARQMFMRQDNLARTKRLDRQGLEQLNPDALCVIGAFSYPMHSSTPYVLWVQLLEEA